MYILFSFVMLLSLESFAMDDAREAVAESPEGRLPTALSAPPAVERRVPVAAESQMPVTATPDDSGIDDEVAGLFNPPPILRTPWSATDQANALKSDIKDLIEVICPGALALLAPSPLLSKSPDGLAFFSNPETLAGLEALLGMPDVELFKARIEELKAKFLEEKERALQHVSS